MYTVRYKRVDPIFGTVFNESYWSQETGFRTEEEAWDYVYEHLEDDPDIVEYEVVKEGE